MFVLFSVVVIPSETISYAVSESLVFKDASEMIEWKKRVRHEHTLLRAMKRHKRHEEVKVVFMAFAMNKINKMAYI